MQDSIQGHPGRALAGRGGPRHAAGGSMIRMLVSEGGEAGLRRPKPDMGSFKSVYNIKRLVDYLGKRV